MIRDAADRVAVPAPDVAYRDEGGRVSLSRRKFGPVGTGVLRLFRLAPDLTVRLDPLGSAVWRLLDGRRTVGEVLERLREQFPDEQDLPARLGQYLGKLASRDLVRLEGAPRA